MNQTIGIQDVNIYDRNPGRIVTISDKGGEINKLGNKQLHYAGLKAYSAAKISRLFISLS